MKYKVHYFLRMGLLFNFFAVNLEAAMQEQNFNVNGSLIQYIDGETNSEYNFSVSIGSCKWLIRVTPKMAGPVDYFEDGYDGTNVYRYISLNPANIPKDAINTSDALVEEDEIPNRDSTFGTAIWLAYASSCYLHTVKNGMVKPFMLFGDPTAKNELVNVQLETSASPPFLPTRVYYEPANRMYQVMEFTNVDGLLVPSKFSLKSFPVGTATTNSPTYELVGVLAKFADNISISDFHPLVGGKTYTEDRRFTSTENPDLKVIYNNKSTGWLSKDSSQLNLIAQKAKYEDDQKTNKTPKRKEGKMIALFILMLPTVVLSIFLIMQTRKRVK